jgi:hypothetical protein
MEKKIGEMSVGVRADVIFASPRYYGHSEELEFSTTVNRVIIDAYTDTLASADANKQYSLLLQHPRESPLAWSVSVVDHLNHPRQ